MRTTTTIRGIEGVREILAQIAPREAKNIMRATVHDMAKQLKEDAVADMPEDQGTMKRATKHKRERVVFGRLRSTVRVGREAFYWRFLEYGTGPDRVAYDFFLKAVHKMRANYEARFMEAFGRKFEAALARARRRS